MSNFVKLPVFPPIGREWRVEKGLLLTASIASKSEHFLVKGSKICKIRTSWFPGDRRTLAHIAALSFKNSRGNGKRIGLLRNGTEALARVRAIVTGGIDDQADVPMQQGNKQ